MLITSISVLALVAAVTATNIFDERQFRCNRDNCFRAVAGTARPSASISQAVADCNSFVAITTTLPAE